MVRSLSFAGLLVSCVIVAAPGLAREAASGVQPGTTSVGPAYQMADLIGDECKLWNKGCHATCNNKVPKIVAGGAVIGSASPNAPHNTFQRAQMLAQCQADCMKAYPICKP